MKREQWSNWYSGTEQEWQALSMAKRHDTAFAKTGCEIAYPTWQAPVNCVHDKCRIRRSEIPAIVETYHILQYEADRGWLLFLSRVHKARVFIAMRRAARESEIYDPWKIPGGWQALVMAGVS